MVSIVTHSLVGGAAESETGVVSLSSDFIRDGPKLVLLGYIKIVVCSGFGNSCVNGFHCHMYYCRDRQGLCRPRREGSFIC